MTNRKAFSYDPIHDENLPKRFLDVLKELKSAIASKNFNAIEEIAERESQNLSTYALILASKLQSKTLKEFEKANMAFAYFILFLHAENTEELLKLVFSNLKDEENTSMSVGFLSAVLFSGKEELIDRFLEDPSLRPLVLMSLLHANKDMLEKYYDKILHLAKTEIDLTQHLALRLLSYFIEREEAKKVFIDYLDDWDKKVVDISAHALLHAPQDEEIAKRAEQALLMERDKEVAALFKKLIEKHKKSD